MSKLVFLSHIHEEKELAIIIKNALESEFAGFVDVFVSSDGLSIPAGANFLNRIEGALVDCVAGLYLISPVSVNRNWINFELGAVWMKNILSLRSGADEIPALPICHSGSNPGKLPAPLNNLNGIQANVSSSLEFAFRSIQRTVGGRGALRTDFDNLAAAVLDFESNYTLKGRMSELLNLISGEVDVAKLCEYADSASAENISINLLPLPELVVRRLEDFLSVNLVGVASIQRNGMRSGKDSSGKFVNSILVDLTIRRMELVASKAAILAGLQKPGAQR